MSSPSPQHVSTRRRTWALRLAVLLAGIFLTFAASRVTGPSFDEEHRVAEVHRATEVARAVSDYGLGSIGSSSAQAVYEEIAPGGELPTLLSGWLGEVFAEKKMLDLLTGARFGWLLWTALAPGALFVMVEAGFGARVGAVAASALLAMPRFFHAAAAAQEPAVVASIWLVCLAAYVLSITPSRSSRRTVADHGFRRAAPVFALFLGLGVASDLATLWVLPFVILHFWMRSGKSTLRAFRDGRAPVPSAFLWALVITPVALVVSMPLLWRGGGASAAGWILPPLSPQIEPTLFRGAPIASVHDVPVAYALVWTLATTPLALLLLALGGLFVVTREGLSVRRGMRPSDTPQLGLLLVMALVFVFGGAAVTPGVFTRFPPRAEAALPFVAALGALAVDRAATRMVGRKWSLLAIVPVCLGMVLFGLTGVPTSSASFGLLGGRTLGAVQSRMWTVGDGSELAVLAPRIDSLGVARAPIETHDVPRGYFALLNETKRLKTRVDQGRSPHGYVLSRGAEASTVARVVRDGAVLWSLSKK